MRNLSKKLQELESPIEVGVVGAGVFGTKLVDQIERGPGMRTSVIADINLDAGRDTFREAGVDSDSVTVVEEVDETDEVIAKALPASRFTAGAEATNVVTSTGRLRLSTLSVNASVTTWISCSILPASSRPSPTL